MEITGDTRFDRVVEIANAKKKIPLVETFKGIKPCFIIGSSWPEDIKVILPVLNKYPSLKVLIAPHEIKENNLREIEKTSLSSIRFSAATPENVSDKQVLIIDNIGMLSSLYAYADYAAIGGAFGKGLHNTLEAAVFGMPLFFGPTYYKFKEAIDLVKKKIAFSIKNSNEFEEALKSFIHAESLRQQTAEKAIEYVRKNTGATDQIISQSLTLLV
jgi:3-deoxy-D-manno-octulosonic-acid transferase